MSSVSNEQFLSLCIKYMEGQVSSVGGCEKCIPRLTSTRSTSRKSLKSRARLRVLCKSHNTYSSYSILTRAPGVSAGSVTRTSSMLLLQPQAPVTPTATMSQPVELPRRRRPPRSRLPRSRHQRSRHQRRRPRRRSASSTGVMPRIPARA